MISKLFPTPDITIRPPPTSLPHFQQLNQQALLMFVVHDSPLDVYAVPPEIWDKIFLHAMPPLTRSMPVPRRSSGVDPRFSISQTCTRWRDIALSRPSMWRELVVYIRGEQQTPNWHLVELIVQRSGDFPLFINLGMINTNDSMFHDPTSAMSRTMELLCGSITRWKEVRLYIRDCGIPRSLYRQRNATRAPLLNLLEIDAQLEYRESDRFFNALWEKSPQLQKLLFKSSKSSDAAFLSRVPPTIPYTQLTSLFIHNSKSRADISGSLAVKVLHSACNLVSCVIPCISLYHGSSIARFPRALNLPRLEYLHLAMRPGSSRMLPSELPLTLVLDYITAPSLKVIAFSNMDMWGQAEFEGFIARSGCSLEEIHFFNPTNFGSSTLMPILSGTPSIRGLHLGCMQNLLDEPTFVIDMIAWNTSRAEFALCPNLSWLSFRDPTSFDIIPDCDINSLGMYGLRKIIKTRLSLPEGGERRFERVYIPRDVRESYDTIRELEAVPYTLNIQYDDGEMYSIFNIWKRYGNR